MGAVTLKASSFFYDEETDCYRVKFAESQLISHDALKKSVILLIPSCKVQTCSQTQQLKEEDIDSILDEIAAKEKHKKKPIKEEQNKSHSDITPNQSETIKVPKINQDKKENKEQKPPKLRATPSEKEKLAQKLASIPKPRKDEKHQKPKL